MTNIGCGARPARTSSASRTVSRTWLSSTARRWALNSSPSRGTLPWTAATVTAWSSSAPDTGLADLRPGQRGGQQDDADAHAGQHHGRRSAVWSARRHHCTISRAMAARLNPASTTANDNSGAPPICAMGSSGPLVWLNPTTPQGNPPNGTVDLAHSWATHSAANQSGQPGSRRTATASRPNNAGKHRLARRQCEPREGADQSADPRQQWHVERQPEQESVPETADQSGGFAGQHPGQQGERDDRRYTTNRTAESSRTAAVRRRSPHPCGAAGEPRASPNRLARDGISRFGDVVRRPQPWMTTPRWTVCRHRGNRSSDPSRGNAGTRDRGSVDQRCTASAGALTSKLVGVPHRIRRGRTGHQGAGDAVAHAAGPPRRRGSPPRTPPASTARCRASGGGSPRAPSTTDSCW